MYNVQGTLLKKMILITLFHAYSASAMTPVGRKFISDHNDLKVWFLKDNTDVIAKLEIKESGEKIDWSKINGKNIIKPLTIMAFIL